jgi:hypothetical protein
MNVAVETAAEDLPATGRGSGPATQGTERDWAVSSAANGLWGSSTWRNGPRTPAYGTSILNQLPNYIILSRD